MHSILRHYCNLQSCVLSLEYRFPNPFQLQLYMWLQLSFWLSTKKRITIMTLHEVAACMFGKAVLEGDGASTHTYVCLRWLYV